MDATLLALAGLKRLNMQDLINDSQVIPFSSILPAVAQGAIGIQCRDNDPKVIRLLQQLNCPWTNAAVSGERAFLASLDGNCRTPIACQFEYAPRKEKEKLRVRAMMAKPDGTGVVKAATEIPLSLHTGNSLSQAQQLQAIHKKAVEVGASLGDWMRSKLVGPTAFAEYQESFDQPIE